MPHSTVINYTTAIGGWFAGTFAGGLVGMQTVEPGAAAAWAGVISALVVAVFMLVGKLLDKYFEGKDKRVKRDDELRQREIQFWKDHSNIKTLEAFEARLRAHRAVNELNLAHGHIHICHRAMAAQNIAIPDFKFRFGEELMHGIEEEVAKFKKSLAERLDEALHKTNG